MVRWARIAACLCAAALTVSAQVTVSLDRSTLYQTVEGFGYEPNFKPWKEKSGPFLVDVDPETTGVFDSIVTELGATMIRQRPLPEFQADSGVFDCTPLQGKYGWFDMVRRLRVIHERENEPLLMIGQVWSPPGWMKVGGTTGCADQTRQECALKVGYEDDFGHHLVRFVQTMRDSTGVDYYAMSIQDEPSFKQTWESCVYTGTRYVETLKGVASVFRDEGLQTRFFGAEHMDWAFPSEFERAVRMDPQALAYMHAWAVHGYEYDNEADTGSYAGSTPTQKPLWRTSGGTALDSANDWAGAMSDGNDLMHFLRESKGSAWTWFVIMGNSTGSDYPGYCLIHNGKPNAIYYVSSHYFRYIRPGARQIGSSSSDDSVRVVAFNHEQNQCISVVLLNRSSVEKTVGGITGSGGPTRFERVVSTADVKLTRDSVDASADIALPPNSITTLVSGAYRNTGTTAVMRRPRSVSRSRAARPDPGAVRVYSIDGRLINRQRPTSHAVGVYITRTSNGAQRTVRLRSADKR